MKNSILSFFFFLLLAQPAFVQAQGQPRVFHLETIRNELFGLRKSTVEHITVSGDHTAAGDQRMLDTLREFLKPRIYSADQKHSWKKYSRVVKRITFERANLSSLPDELGEFGHLSELNFVACPHITLQGINDQVKALDKSSNLYEKFHEELISLTFQDASWNVNAFALEPGLFSDLREVRLIRIHNFQACCVNLLGELQRCVPDLGWLTLADCGLDNSLPLDTLRSFTHLQALSMPHNRLTRVPELPKSLHVLDLSFNLLSQLDEKTPTPLLQMLYLDCNLLHRTALTDTLTRKRYPKLGVLTFECNNLYGQEIRATTRTLDSGHVASFMSYAPRYVNNFRPESPDCTPCFQHRRMLASALLGGVLFTDSDGASCQLSFHPNEDKIMVKKSASSVTYDVVELKKCEQNSAQEWVVTFEVKEVVGFKTPEKYLIAKVTGQQGVLTTEQ